MCVCGVAGGGLGGGNQVGYDWGVGEEEVSVVAGVHIELMHLGWGVDGSTKCTEGVFVCAHVDMIGPDRLPLSSVQTPLSSSQ